MKTFARATIATRSARLGGRTLRRSLLAAMLLGTSATAAGGQVVSQTDPVLNPGDALRVLVWRNAELSGEFDVAADGTLFHPYYSSVVVAGIPMSEARAKLQTVIFDQVQTGALFTLQPLLRIAVEGEVAQPTLYRHPPETTVDQAIALAGGATELGLVDRVRLIRQGAVTTIDLRDPTAAAGRIPIQSGDRIVVDRRGTTFREYLLPTLSVIGTIASLANLFRRR